jgi:hypothetical protein
MSKPDSQRPAFRRGPLPLAADALSLVRQQLAARGFSRIELVTRWAEIAGRGLAEHCFPYRLLAGGASGSTLTLVADDRAALELQHQTPKVIERINSYFGSAVVSKIKVVAGTVPTPPARQAPKRPLSAQEERELAARADAIEDPTLRAALTRLGRHALAESRRPATLKR